MNTSSSFIVLIICILSIQLIQNSLASVVSTQDFNKDFFVTWSPSHVSTSADGQERSLKLDQESGSAFASNDVFLFGQFDMKIKLIPRNSAGAVVAFYLSSNQPNRDEVDFEFLGNEPGQPYIVQTNAHVDGFDNREQRIKLWFDPTEDFHTYSYLVESSPNCKSNEKVLVGEGVKPPITTFQEYIGKFYQANLKKARSWRFMVDWVPIRTHKNHANKEVAFPRWQPMSIQVSIRNGEDWATRGGKDKIDWSKSPFIASFKNPKVDACVWKGNARFCRANTPSNCWNNDNSSTLTWPQRRLFGWVRKYHLIYDYCEDTQRFQNGLPKECSLPKH